MRSNTKARILENLGLSGEAVGSTRSGLVLMGYSTIACVLTGIFIGSGLTAFLATLAAAGLLTAVLIMRQRSVTK